MCEHCFPSARLSRRDSLRLFGAGALLALLPLGRRVRRPAVDPVSVAPGLLINPRAAWAGDLGPTGPMGAEEVKFLLVHHTASPNDYDPSGVIPVLQSAYRYHTGADKGWPDVAYNFLIDRFGGVWEGRAGSLAGPVVADATGGSQGFAQLVCLIGDFTSVMPTDAALRSLTLTLAWLSDRHELDTGEGSTVEFVSRGSNRWPEGVSIVTPIVSGHRDMSSTACPGDTFYPFVHSEIQAVVHAHRVAAASSVTTTAPVGSSTTTTSSTTTSTTVAPTTSSESPPSFASAAPIVSTTEPAADVATSSSDDDGFLVVAAATAGVGLLGGAVLIARRSGGARAAGGGSADGPDIGLGGHA